MNLLLEFLLYITNWRWLVAAIVIVAGTVCVALFAKGMFQVVVMQ